MAGPHPLFNIDDILNYAFRDLIRVNWRGFISLGLLAALQIASEMLQKSYLLLQFFRVLCKSIFFADVLTISASSLIVVKVITVRI